MPPKILTVHHDPTQHHLEGPFMPQTPLSGTPIPSRVASPVPERHRNVSPLLRWAIDPTSALQVLLVPVVLYVNWEFLSPNIWSLLHKSGLLPQYEDGIPNPFAPFFLLSHRVPTSSPDDPRYQKGYLDLLFVAYYVVFWSLMRQIIAVNISGHFARRVGIRREAKVERFGEQVYAIFYWGSMGLWGWRIMTQLPTNWYQTQYYWIDYPHWDMKPELKRYYLMQMAYWSQQLFVMVLGLEKKRKDYAELVSHHIVTIWMVGWSYLINLTLIGNAVYLSMDIPDTFLATSKLLNYLQMDKSKSIAFAGLLVAWTYFRHILNLKILYSVWFEFDLIPEVAKQWSPKDGVWLVWWMRYQIFVPILLLQFLNLFWYFLIWRILYRALTSPVLDDDRSDDEEDEAVEKKRN